MPLLMASAMREFPRRLVENPQKWEEYVRTFDTRMLAAAILSPVGLTAWAQAMTWIFRGRLAEGGRWGLLLPWALVCAMALAALAGRREIRRQRERRIPGVCWAFGTLQAVWLPCLAWYSLPEFAVIAGVALCAMAFHDARCFYDATWLRVHYLLAWLAFLVLLLGVDALGGPGLLARAHAAPQYLRMAISFVAMIAVLVQIILAVVGRQWYRSEARVWAHNLAQIQLAEMRREREVIACSCDFIAKGVTAGQFSHDLVSPLSTVSLSADRLREELAKLTDELGARGEQDLRARLTSLHDAAESIVKGSARLHEMAAALLRSLRQPSALGPTDVRALVGDAIREMNASSARHGTHAAPPIVELEPTQVFVGAEHAAALGSILCNGALQNPQTPLRVHGREAGPWFYLLSIRDTGVAIEQRAAALERVRAALVLTESGTPRASTHAGFGVGLTLAKLLLVRHNGWLAVEEPAHGPGLVFQVALPRVAPDSIPASENTPERIASEQPSPRGPDAALANSRAAGSYFGASGAVEAEERPSTASAFRWPGR